ncbi:hypothetical protein ASD65_02650 [Microbacterium sp. Root61]|uniref:ABC transporter ATP-binding protein n=1 Tax=Microbacterium sp. Root61 TaxID=1736570 RepID=UPI0006F622BC|nr:ABC transporter ATP-binding protein [Microbacterium sp. Root61]KRA23436.1 hypothetical protein ASD65_02650 [Microbacterium sp. Root61]
MSEPLLQVENLTVTLHTPQGDLVAAENVSFDVLPGEMMGLVGESGSGKSIILRAIMGLLPREASVTGHVRWRGVDYIGAPERLWKALRGRHIGMVFQDPMTALNPIRRIGPQLVEGPQRILGWSRREAARHAVELLESVRIPDPQRVLRQYPHELSGGMRQRVVIAMAMACEPELILCDEPTTALDVTVQAKVLDLIGERTRTMGSAVILVSHDLAVVAQLCSSVQVMYAGQLVERGPIDDVFADPRHAYTAALLGSLPDIDAERRRPVSIPGELPDRFLRPSGCRFHLRCNVAGEVCPDEDYALRQVGVDALLSAAPGRGADDALERGSACFYDLGIPDAIAEPAMGGRRS